MTLENTSFCNIKYRLGVSQIIEFEDSTKEEVPIGKATHGNIMYTCILIIP